MSDMMTTKDMKLALLWYFRWRLQYPIVVTECLIGSCPADIIAIRKAVVEVEIKRKFSEVKRDLKDKWWKHQRYLRSPKERTTHYLHRRPNRFYFALPDTELTAECLQRCDEEIPRPYGMIRVASLYHCQVVKRALYITRENEEVDQWKEILMKRLTAENIDLRIKLHKRNQEEVLV